MNPTVANLANFLDYNGVFVKLKCGEYTLTAKYVHELLEQLSPDTLLNIEFEDPKHLIIYFKV